MFERLLTVISGSIDFGKVNTALTWEKAVRVRSQVQRRLSESEVELLGREYLEGATSPELASRFGIHRTSVLAVLERSNVVRRGHGPSEEQVAGAVQLYQDGMSTAKIGSQLGFSGETIRQRLIKSGIEMRPRRGF